ncbi:MAG: hypothetical protein JOZ54_10320 [Acidobacteria bacterium]|nr:hypothetical protein [Acidobacteriota bacterium]
MRSTIKAGVVTLTLVTVLTAPAFAANRQDRDRDTTAGFTRTIAKIARFIGYAYDSIIIPHP